MRYPEDTDSHHPMSRIFTGVHALRVRVCLCLQHVWCEVDVFLKYVLYLDFYLFMTSPKKPDCDCVAWTILKRTK